MKKTTSLIIGAIIILGGFFYFRYQVYFSHQGEGEKKIFEISKGEGSSEIAEKLVAANLITGKAYFYYYLKTHDLTSNILPGKYELNNGMTIPDIIITITNKKNILPGYIEITFPEGLTIKQMADKISANGLDGQGFLALAQKPAQNITTKFEYLKEVKSLEGYLFPDTYFFAKDINAEGMILKMLNNFDNKLDTDLLQEITKQKKTVAEIITLASIVEKEVSLDSDRAVVAGLFWNRLAEGQALQSDATLSYLLGDTISQHTLAETKIDSPYNTYLKKGLPPGPICNPGLAAIKATIFPEKTDFFYFLSDPKTGKTIFAKSFSEHVENRRKYGL
jgi:UPF0755 protein